MKKIYFFILVMCLSVGLLAGCGGQGEGSLSDSSSQDTQTENIPESEPEGQDDQNDNEEDSDTSDTAASSDQTEDVETGKTLVVYYSATGYTEKAANAIAQSTGGDLFQLEPSVPYTDEDLDWTDDDSRVSVEYANPDQRDVELVSETVDNWESYDTVFIGYPIWWGIAAWPVDTFIKANDFTGKTVIPFCTSTSSGFGESGSLLEEMAGTGEWMEGERFRSGVSDADVEAWVESLGL